MSNFFNFDNMVVWLFGSGLRIVLLFAVAYILVRVLRVFIFKVAASLFRKSSSPLAKKNIKFEENRLKTLANVIFYVCKTVVWLAFVVLVLPEFGFAVAPLLAGLGIGGLALGMAARDLLQDYLYGIYILIEDQFRVGEEIEASNFKGKVKSFTLRRTSIIDEAGRVRFVPNGQIKILTNLSRQP